MIVEKGRIEASSHITIALQNSGEIAQLSRVSQWLRGYEEQKITLGDIIDSGPVAYDFRSGVWSAPPMITRVIEEEFDITYPPGHVRKLICQLGVFGTASETPADQSGQRKTKPMAPI